MRNGGAGFVQQRRRLGRPSLTEQNFGLQELELEQPVGTAEITAKLNAFVRVFQSLGKIAPAL